MERRVALRDEVSAGLIAGLGGAIVTHLWYFAAQALSGKTLDPAGLYGFIASALFGRAAYGSPASIPIGLALHGAVAIGWALGYVYLVRSQPQLLARPWISGIGFGLVVYVFMEIVLLTAGLYHRPTPAGLLNALLGHTLFFGVPVALLVSRRLRPA